MNDKPRAMKKVQVREIWVAYEECGESESVSKTMNEASMIVIVIENENETASER